MLVKSHDIKRYTGDQFQTALPMTSGGPIEQYYEEEHPAARDTNSGWVILGKELGP